MGRIRREVPWLDWRDGVAYVRWYDSEARTTRGLSLRTRDPAEAQARYAAFLVEGAALTGSTAGAPKITVAQALDLYEREHVQAELPFARARVIRSLLANLREYFGEMHPQNIGEEDGRRYTAYRRAQGRKPGTIRRELSALRTAINHNIRARRLSADDKPYIKLPRAPRTRNLWLFKDELQKLRKHALGRVRDFIEIAYWTGSRRGVVERLRWAQVSVEREFIDFREHGAPETTKRRPVVRIPPELLPRLQRLYEARETEWVLGIDKPIADDFTRAARAAGLLQLPERDGRPRGNLTPHILRHTRATHLLNDGVSPWAVAGLLGDTVDTVLRVYGHQSSNFMDEIARADGAIRASFLE